MRFWIDDYRNPYDHVKDWGKNGDVWSKSYEEFLMNLQICLDQEKRIEHIYYDYNLGPAETGLDCARLVTSKNWEWALNENTTWSSHSSDPYGREKIVALMDSWREKRNLIQKGATQVNTLKTTAVSGELSRTIPLHCQMNQ